MPLPSKTNVDLSQVHLYVFLTDGMSLTNWDELGMFDRELELYRRLRPHLSGITIISYGSGEDLKLLGRMAGMNIVCNSLHLPLWAYKKYLVHWFSKSMAYPAVVKTNQSFGGDLALMTAKQGNTAFVSRCGYLISDFTTRQYGADSQKVKQAKALEKKLFTSADQVVTTTSAMAAVVLGYGVSKEKCNIIPNYVITDWFGAAPRQMDKVKRIVSIARLTPQKNLDALIKAMTGYDCELILIGDGYLHDELSALAQECGVEVKFLGLKPSREIPDILAGCDLFILPSKYEGHPKALLEGMASGLPVIGTDTPGIRAEIDHGKTGWLCGTSSTEIAEAIGTLIKNKALRKKIGNNAQAYIKENYSLEIVLPKELSVIETAASNVYD